MNELLSLKNKNYALSGGTGTLGGSIAEYLVRNGARVLLLGRSVDKLKSKQSELNDIVADSTFIFKVDVMNEEELKALKDHIKKEFKHLDGLVNLAGGTVTPTVILSELMVEQGYGSIINISSMAAKQSISRVLGYSMAKGAVDIFTKWMANELASKHGDKIRVNAIAPGFFIGNQNRRLLTNEDGSFTERGNSIIKNTPMGRFGDASELNGMVHYLLSDASSFVTGSIFDVDGGFSSFSGV